LFLLQWGTYLPFEKVVISRGRPEMLLSLPWNEMDEMDIPESWLRSIKTKINLDKQPSSPSNRQALFSNILRMYAGAKYGDFERTINNMNLN
jgi:hypothetical protein